MGWRVIEINTDEYFQLYFNNLLIKRFNEKILINIADIDIIIFNNDRAMISIKLINALTNANVGILFMNEKHLPTSHVVPVNGHHFSLKILNSQIKWTHSYKALVWQNLIKNKISNQIANCLRLNLDGELLRHFSNDVKAYDITNREGHAAKVYWHQLFGLKFIRDYKSILNPVINTMLNYGYALIRTLVIKSIIKKGLDPRIGIFHKSFSNFFALASDLMEVYRPLVDYLVYQNKEAVIFKLDIKTELKKVLDHKISINNEKFFISNAIDKQVDYLISGKGHLWINLWD